MELVLQTAGRWCGQGHCSAQHSGIHSATNPWIPKAAGGTGVLLLGFSCPLLQSAEPCSTRSTSLLLSTVHWGDWQNSPVPWLASHKKGWKQLLGFRVAMQGISAHRKKG